MAMNRQLSHSTPALVGTAPVTTVERLRDLPPGTAYVETVTVQGEETLVRLRYPGGRVVVVSVRARPNPADLRHPPAVRRLLAVQIHAIGGMVHCSVVGTSRTGPRRVPIGLVHALTLAQSGVHAVLRSR
jgi:hypothetical protein